ncbi:MAG: hypothetical protein ABF904_11575 [Ethanoligenens sp.]
MTTWKKAVRSLFCCGLATALILIPSLDALAYINRGTVAVSLGETSAQVAAGQTTAISAMPTPASHDELPGCGMSYCPQQCSPGCVNDTGDCVCNGKTYTTYQAGLVLTSADTGIATATYADGVITVAGHKAGTTTISAVGTLRQYSSSTSQKIRVTVTGSTSGAATSSGLQTGTVSSTSPGASSTVGNAAAVQTVTGQLGTFDFLEIAPGKTGKKEFEAVKGKDKTATFEKKDADGNVAYSWSFKGTNVTDPADMDFTIAFSSKDKAAMEKTGTLVEPFYLSFTHEGALPGPANISVNTGSYYPAGTSLYLYTYNPQSRKLGRTGGSVKLENGYTSFTISHCSDYVLVAKPVTSNMVIPLPIAAALCAVVAAAVAGGIMFLLLRRKTGAVAPSPAEQPKKETQL